MWLDTYVPVCRIVLDSVTELPDFFWRSPTGCRRLQALETCQPSLMSHQLLKIFFSDFSESLILYLLWVQLPRWPPRPHWGGCSASASNASPATAQTARCTPTNCSTRIFSSRKCSPGSVPAAIASKKTALSIENLTKNYLTKFRTIREGGGTATTLLIR